MIGNLFLNQTLRPNKRQPLLWRRSLFTSKVLISRRLWNTIQRLCQLYYCYRISPIIFFFLTNKTKKMCFGSWRKDLRSCFFLWMNFFLKVSPTKKYICHAVISGTIFNSILFFSNYSLTSQIIFRTPCQKKSVNPMLAVF